MAMKETEVRGKANGVEWKEEISWIVPPEREKFFTLDGKEFVADLEEAEVRVAQKDPLGTLFHLVRALDTAFRVYARIPKGLSIAVPMQLLQYRTFKNFVTSWKDRLISGSLAELRDENIFNDAFAAISETVAHILDETHRLRDERRRLLDERILFLKKKNRLFELVK